MGGAPMPIRIMSEDLVLFRDDKGQFGSSANFVRIGALICRMDAWRMAAFAVSITAGCLTGTANCSISRRSPQIENSATVLKRAATRSGKGGAIWTYMGRGEPPLIPDSEFLAGPEPNRMTFRVIQAATGLQGSNEPILPTRRICNRRWPGKPSVRLGRHCRVAWDSRRR